MDDGSVLERELRATITSEHKAAATSLLLDIAAPMLSAGQVRIAVRFAKRQPVAFRPDPLARMTEDRVRFRALKSAAFQLALTLANHSWIQKGAICG